MNISETMASLAYDEMWALYEEIEKKDSERLPGVQLADWNAKHKELWMGFVAKGLVEKNDWEKFHKFSKNFHAFWDKNKRYPTTEEAEDLLK